jgi:hypothetical protein
MPKEFSVALPFTESDSSGGTPAARVRTYGLFEVLGNRPLYMAELFSIYRYCRITAVHVQMEVVNTSSTVPLRMVAATVPWNDSTTIDTLSQRPGAIVKIVGLSTGSSKAVIRKTWHTQVEQGNPVYDKTYWFDSTQSASTTPQDTQEMSIRCAIQAVDGASSFNVESVFRVIYHVQFFDLETPSAS